MTVMPKRLRPRPIPPTPDEIRKRRVAAGLSVEDAAALVYVDPLSWQRYENGSIAPRPAVWRLFCLRLDTGDIDLHDVSITPTPREIVLRRISADLTQIRAADLVGVSLQSWQRYESGENKPNAAVWELFRILTRLIQTEGDALEGMRAHRDATS